MINTTINEVSRALLSIGECVLAAWNKAFGLWNVYLHSLYITYRKTDVTVALCLYQQYVTDLCYMFIHNRRLGFFTGAGGQDMGKSPRANITKHDKTDDTNDKQCKLC